MAEANKVKWQEVGGREEEGEMKPWEQHSAVISIPRFDYNAASALLHRSHSGFLVTCPIKREKSATKEAISILKKFTGFFDTSSSECLEGTDSDITAKRRKICREEIDGECLSIIESKNTTASRDTDGGKLSEDACSSSAKSDSNVEKTPILSLVKMTRSGLLLFTIPRNDSPDVVSIVSNIFCSLESRSLSPPLWCHRIFPIQATCCLNEKELHAVVSKLVIQFVNDRQNNLQRPLKFAVGYNRRGIEETQMKMSRNTPKDCEELALLDRNKCFGVVAAAVKNAVSDAIVDLKSPELSVLVELLPLSGLPNGSLVVAVSVLPPYLVTTKPRLCIKALLSDTEAKNGRKNA